MPKHLFEIKSKQHPFPTMPSEMLASMITAFNESMLVERRDYSKVMPLLCVSDRVRKIIRDESYFNRCDMLRQMLRHEAALRFVEIIQKPA